MPSKKILKNKKRPLGSELALASRPRAKKVKQAVDSIWLSDVAPPAPPTIKDEDAMDIDVPTSLVDKLFKSMPVEIHQKIAEYLPRDTDIIGYSRLCHRTNASISTSVWRKRFVQTFDNVEGATPVELMRKYMFRRSCTKDYVIFDTKPRRRQLEAMGEWHKNEKNQRWSLEVLRELILQSDARKGHNDEGDQVIIGLNQECIRKFTHWPPLSDQEGHTDLMAAVQIIGDDLGIQRVMTRRARSAKPDNLLPLAMVIQLCLSYLFLHPSTCNGPVAHFDDSQRQAYLCHKVVPVFYGDMKHNLNISWLLHVVNFFKLHLKADNEGFFVHAYNRLAPDQLPQPWLGKIEEGTKQFGNHWKGAYTFLDREDLAKIRQTKSSEEEPLMDAINDGHDYLQDLTVFFDDNKFSEKDWPRAWEEMVRGNPFQDPKDQASRNGSASTRRRSLRGKSATPEVKHFYGSAVDGKASHFFGRVHALPPQEGIHGFQRVAMMKFFPDEYGNYDPAQVWSYEGCMLPGGRLIVGRWWASRDELVDPTVQSFSGPFIFWNVDESAAAVPIKGEEALDFLDSINDTLVMGN